MRAMMRKMLNNSDAAVMLAMKMLTTPLMKLPVNSQVVRKVAATAGTTTFFLKIITTMMVAIPIR